MKSKYKGIFFVLCSAFCFTLMNAFVRLSGDLPFEQKAFFRNIIAFIFAMIIIKKEHISPRWQKGNLKHMLIRAVCGTLGLLCNFYAVDHLVLSDASMLNKMSPFFALIFSYFFLKENINFVQGFAVITAFAGSLLIIKPSFGDIDFFPSLIGLIGGMGAGAAYTAVRYLGGRGEKGPVIVMFFSGFSSIVILPYVLFNYVPMTWRQWIILLLAGLAAACGQFSITAAYCHAPAREISVYDYSQVVFSAILGFFIFSQVPDWWSVLGYLVICGCAAGMFIYNKKSVENR